MNIKRVSSPPSPATWVSCGWEYGFELFKTRPPLEIAKGIIKTTFKRNLDNEEFCYVVRKYNNSDIVQDQVEVYQKIK